jgi:hypothetical protein
VFRGGGGGRFLGGGGGVFFGGGGGFLFFGGDGLRHVTTRTFLQDCTLRSCPGRGFLTNTLVHTRLSAAVHPGLTVRHTGSQDAQIAQAAWKPSICAMHCISAIKLAVCTRACSINGATVAAFTLRCKQTAG